MKSELKIKGRVKATIRDASTNRILEERITENLIVNVGKRHIADLLIGAAQSSFRFCGVGSSNQQPSPSDTDLIQPIQPRKQVTDRFRTASTATFSTFFSSQDNKGVWRECGLFTDQTEGVMLARALFTPEIVKDESKTVTLDWDIEVA